VRPIVTRGLGGLVTVLTEVLREHDGTWIATALGDEESHLAEQDRSVEVELDGDTYRVRYVSVAADVYDKYYNIVANPILWFIQHYLWDLGRHPDISPNERDAWENGYVPVQRLFAEAIVDEAGAGRAGGTGGAAGTGPRVRRARHAARLPSVRGRAPGTQGASRRLPAAVRAHPLGAERRVAGAAQGHARRHLRRAPRQRHRRLPHAALRAQLPPGLRRSAGPPGGPGAPHGHRRGPGGLGARLPRVHRPAGAQERPRERSVWRPRRRPLLERRREFLLVRVDRLDLSKNIIRGFLAFDRFLELYPEFCDSITFLALLQPSREDVEEYVTYRERVMRTVEQINTKYGNTDWMPIDVRIQDNFRRPWPPTGTTTRSWSTPSSTA